MEGIENHIFMGYNVLCATKASNSLGGEYIKIWETKNYPKKTYFYTTVNTTEELNNILAVCYTSKFERGLVKTDKYLYLLNIPAKTMAKLPIKKIKEDMLWYIMYGKG